MSEERRKSKSRKSYKSSLFIRNLSLKSKPEDVKKLFSKYAEVKDVYLPTDYKTGDPRGFGFIEFYSKDEALEALDKTDGAELHGSKISVMVAKEGRKTPSEMKDRGHHRRHRSGSRGRKRRHRRSSSSRSSRSGSRHRRRDNRKRRQRSSSKSSSESRSRSGSNDGRRSNKNNHNKKKSPSEEKRSVDNDKKSQSRERSRSKSGSESKSRSRSKSKS